MKYIVYIIASLCLLCGCASQQQPSSQDNRLNEKLIFIAKDKISKERPEWSDELKQTPQVFDMDDHWMVTFPLPQPKGVISFGGCPVVLIDKRTMEVIRLYHTQ